MFQKTRCHKRTAATYNAFCFSVVCCHSLYAIQTLQSRSIAQGILAFSHAIYIFLFLRPSLLRNFHLLPVCFLCRPGCVSRRKGTSCLRELDVWIRPLYVQIPPEESSTGEYVAPRRHHTYAYWLKKKMRCLEYKSFLSWELSGISGYDTDKIHNSRDR